jgi:hypothetical protein
MHIAGYHLLQGVKQKNSGKNQNHAKKHLVRAYLLLLLKYWGWLRRCCDFQLGFLNWPGWRFTDGSPKESIWGGRTGSDGIWLPHWEYLFLIMIEKNCFHTNTNYSLCRSGFKASTWV